MYGNNCFETTKTEVEMKKKEKKIRTCFLILPKWLPFSVHEKIQFFEISVNSKNVIN